VRYWQVWNEPNEATFWSPGPDAAAYAELLRQTGAAIRRANPDARVLTAGLTGANAATVGAFLQALYDHDAGEAFDILALHPYHTAATPDAYLPRYLEGMRDVLRRNGDAAKRIWITEIGWPTGTLASDAVSESSQETHLRETYRVLDAMPFVERVLWYRLDDTVPEGDWGIYGYNLSRSKPAAQAYSQLSPNP
jgi:arabinogalactan endo-1,4-beta-galactosidase